MKTQENMKYVSKYKRRPKANRRCRWRIGENGGEEMAS